MNEIKVLKETELLGRQFAVYGTFAEPLFLAKDVATMIEHSDVSMMVRDLDDDEKLTQTMFVSGQHRQVMFLKEDGLYEVLMTSRKPIAKAFKKAVKKVLHEIRTTGSYSVNKTASKGKVESYYKAIELKKQLLNLNDSSVAMLINKSDAQLGIVGQEIDYVPSKGVLRSMTYILKANNVPMSAQAANKKLLEKGILRLCTRQAHNGKDKHFLNINEDYLFLGENVVNEKAPSETQPLWYESKSTDIINFVK